MGSASGSGPYQRFPWCLRAPVTTRLRIMVTGGINHAGALRPATPFYPDGCWGYIKGNGVDGRLAAHRLRASSSEAAGELDVTRWSLEPIHISTNFRGSDVRVLAIVGNGQIGRAHV